MMAGLNDLIVGQMLGLKMRIEAQRFFPVLSSLVV